eukprot:maker-scaffold1635_size32709-snap-gene-0.13 protein:Tk07227 transcript:maker-scaffold1635_size32709-snap-gene-0.13-mRNA-1 annotation:"5-methyltetrahydropteroyltriglutamate--homocysteine methyltransferase"
MEKVPLGRAILGPTTLEDVVRRRLALKGSKTTAQAELAWPEKGQARPHDRPRPGRPESDAMASPESDLIRRLWTNYQSSTSEDTWLEQFLPYAVTHLKALPEGRLRREMAVQLSSLWRDELKNICAYFEANPNGEPMDQYVFRNRGWQILYLLEYLVHDPAMEDDRAVLWWDKELVRK